jgi:hypothetical protein
MLGNKPRELYLALGFESGERLFGIVNRHGRIGEEAR